MYHHYRQDIISNYQVTETSCPEEELAMEIDVVPDVQPEVPMQVEGERNMEIIIEENQILKNVLASKNNLLLESQKSERMKQKTIDELRNDLRYVKMKLARRQKKVAELTTELNQLKSKPMLPLFSNPLLVALFKRSSFKDNHNKKPYEQILRDFAITLYYKSPAAYNFVRESLNLALPHENTLYMWFRPIHSKPGWSSQFLTSLHVLTKSVILIT